MVMVDIQIIKVNGRSTWGMHGRQYKREKLFSPRRSFPQTGAFQREKLEILVVLTVFSCILNLDPSSATVRII